MTESRYMTFNELNIITPILKATELANYDTATPIQTEAIPLIIEGKDLLASAQTGTGKTAAFAIPILQKIYENKEPGSLRKIKALVLTPTRELANQVSESFTRYSRFLNLKNTAIYGGVNQRKQESILYKGIDVLIATPGRLLDLMNQGIIQLDEVEYLVLDEADMMFDMGFIKDVTTIIEKVPASRQTLLFSATISKDIERLAKDILTDPVKVEITPEVITLDVITQSLYIVKKAQKTELLLDLIKSQNLDSIIVFMRTKHSANRLALELSKEGIKAESIHSDRTQYQRERALLSFKKGRTKVLVATDIAARGLDIKALDVVINYDLPETPETYIHRIGRTGRAGLSGQALSFCSLDERNLLRTIEKHIGQKINSVEHAFSNEELNDKFIDKPKQRNTTQQRSNKPNNKFGSDKPNFRKKSTKTSSNNSNGESQNFKPKSDKPFADKPKGDNTNYRSKSNKPSTKGFSSDDLSFKPKSRKPTAKKFGSDEPSFKYKSKDTSKNSSKAYKAKNNSKPKYKKVLEY